jgi:hypothetical protein
MHGAVARTWIETTGPDGGRRLELAGRTLRVGAGAADVQVPVPADEWLEIGGDPARLVLHGAGPPPLVNGRPLRELVLAHGDRIEWGATVLVFRSEDPARGLQPLVVSGGGTQLGAQLDPVVAARLQAGLLCELQLVDRAATRRWQDAVVAGAFDPDAAAVELLAAAQAGAGDPRLRERSARLLRDLLMSPLQRGMRGAGRRARTAARSLVAALVSQLLVVVTLLALAIVALAVVRLRWGFSVDGWLDRVIDMAP